MISGNLDMDWSESVLRVAEFKKDQASALVVEDDPTSASAIAKLLRNKCRLRVDIAENLEQAREAIRRNKYSLITLDQLLPDGTGLEFLRELKLVDDSTPVIMVSALEISKLDEDPVELGARDYVIKDETVDSRLIQAVRLALGVA